MYQNIKTMKRIRATALVLGAVALWILLPFYFQLDSSVSRAEENHPGLPDLRAQLTGAPIANVTPTGLATYDTWTFNGTTIRSFTVDVSSVNLPSNTALGVFLNGTNVGQITLNPQRRGELRLSTLNGGTVPTVMSGDTLTVRNGATVVLTGTFSAPATPSPSPSGSPGNHIRLYASLTGAAIGDIIPRGFASYETRSNNNNRELEVFVNSVNLPNGTSLSVVVGDVTVGQLTLNNRQGRFELESNVPTITSGTTIAIRNGATTILAGTFSSTFPTPSPTVSPTVSPSPSPSGSPTPTPQPPRSFSARLRGSNVVPAVTTNGKGLGFVRLNQAQTQITVHLHYFRLSSAATVITINGPALPGANAPVIFTLTNSGGTSGHTPPQTFDVTAAQIVQIRAGLWYFNVSTVTNPTGEIRGQIRANNHRDDYQGDGYADVSVLRSSNNSWYILNTRDFSFTARTMGQAGDINVQGDYDGDGIADLAMFTPATGNWQIRRSESGATVNYRFGQAGDVPVVGDYDGDGRNDLAVFRPSSGAWYIQNSFDGSFTSLSWGMNGDRPVSGDFDGDGLNDVAVFRPSNGGWYIFQSGTQTMLAMQWGMDGDRAVSGDFDGDGATDIAVFRPANGTWYINRSSDGGFSAAQFGASGDVTVACDYDGDGISDIAVYRPDNGYWYILRSSDNALGAYQFGIATDKPSQVAYTP